MSGLSSDIINDLKSQDPLKRYRAWMDVAQAWATNFHDALSSIPENERKQICDDAEKKAIESAITDLEPYLKSIKEKYSK